MGKLILFLLTLSFYLLSAKIASAQESTFTTSITTSYDVAQSGTTTVTHEITLTNLSTTIHAVSYSLITDGVKPINPRALESERQLDVAVETQDTQTKLTARFDNPVVGKGNSRVFSIIYEDEKTAIRNGQVWEISIPKIGNPENYEKYVIRILVPLSFKKPAYLSPEPQRIEDAESKQIFVYDKEQIKTAGIVAAFGKFQVFNFRLLYHLQNPLTRTGITQIALPPDTAFQKVYYQNLNPKPLEIKMDEDGNWLATYKIKAKEQIDIQASGSFQVFAHPQDFYPKNDTEKNHYLAQAEFWEADDQQIKNLARELGTPKAIYDYVVNTLSYDYSRVQENVERLGAKSVLNNPTSAICMEFTDLFITLARASGIPAREVNGFAYTENAELQPLSLVSDVLHAWPEYWDSDRKLWIPVDPTWGNTTGGVDFFSKFDLSHIAFAIHGQNPQEPLPAGSYKLAGNPQKDVEVYFGTLPDQRLPKIKLSLIVQKRLLPFLPFTGRLVVENQGTVAIYNLKPAVGQHDGRVALNQAEIPFLPPFGKTEISFNWEIDSFPKSSNISFLAEGSEVYYTPPIDFFLWDMLGIFVLLILSLCILLIPLVLAKMGAMSKLYFYARRMAKKDGKSNKENSDQHIA